MLDFVDLAIMIAHCYPQLVNVRNMYGNLPLQVLASRPSSFKSGTDFSWCQKILYHCKCLIIHVNLDNLKGLHFNVAH